MSGSGPLFDPFRSLADFLDEADRVLMLTRYAIQEITGLARLAEVLHRDEPESAERIESARKITADAEREVAEGFRLTTSHSAVALWAALEGTVPQFVVRWLSHRPEVLRREPFNKIRLPVASYESLDREALLSEVIEELSRSTQAPLKAGVGRYEALLEHVGLGGGVEDWIRKDLFELSHVRHLVVHRFGAVDARFVQACPWKAAPPGTLLKVTLDDYFRYAKAVRAYAVAVIERARAAQEPRTAANCEADKGTTGGSSAAPALG